LRAIAVAARSLRGLILSAFGAQAIPEVISGHGAGGAPSTQPHMAVFPLADLGWDWSEGRLMGMAIALPRNVSAQDEAAFSNALAFILRRKGSPKFNEVVLPLADAGNWRLVREVAPTRASLHPSRYGETAAVWATATPIVLDRHPKSRVDRGSSGQVSDLISIACQRIGLPAPKQVIPCAHSAIRGSFSAYTPSRLPEWTRWTAPGSLADRPMTHATIVFDRPVQGPIALGAGRFFGLGLCLPLHGEPRS
jgi:CRISPR-associated protein Csb2